MLENKRESFNDQGGGRVSGGGEKGRGEEIFGISPRRGHSVLKSVHHPLFPLEPLPPTYVGLLQFFFLFCLSGQLVQFCQGQHGSNLVLERLREELGLPWSSETGIVFCRQVLLALVETDSRTRLEVVDKVKETWESFSL